MKLTPVRSTQEKLLIKKCHMCGSIHESFEEVRKCKKCHKSFLPTNYFGKVHAKNSEEFDQLFSNSDHIAEEDLVKGLMVIW